MTCLEVPRIAVLMSTYNGEKYLRQQLDSIYAQDGVDIDLIVRDDGSSDGTHGILRYYEANHGLKWSAGENVGVGRSFMQLLYDSPEADYYAFADQDDIWHSDKLRHALRTIERCGVDQPVLYAGNLTVVDEHLNGYGFLIAPRDTEDLNTIKLLFGNICYGCTMTFNMELKNVIIDERHRPSTKLLSNMGHDRWIAIIASIVGTVIFDSDSFIQYRRHGASVTNATQKNLAGQSVRLFRKAQSYLDSTKREKYRGVLCGISKELIDRFPGELNDEICKDLRLLSGYRDDPKKKLSCLTAKRFVHNARDPWYIAVYKFITEYY